MNVKIKEGFFSFLITFNFYNNYTSIYNSFISFISIACTVVISSFLNLSPCYTDLHPLHLYILQQFIIFKSLSEDLILKIYVVYKIH